MDDQRVIYRAHAGDESAWEALIHEHQQPVFRLAYLLVRDADEADDIAQDVFMRAWRALDRFDPSRPLRPWLLQITANVARNRQRSVRRYVAALGRALRAEPEPIAQIGERSAQQWESQTLWQAVQRLSHADQEIIYIRYFLDQSEAETAQALNIAPGTVKARLHRAINRLRTIVERDFPALREERQA